MPFRDYRPIWDQAQKEIAAKRCRIGLQVATKRCSLGMPVVPAGTPDSLRGYRDNHGLALEEARQNMIRKRPEREPMLRQYAEFVEIGGEPNSDSLELGGGHGLPTKDVPILAAAIAQKADLLVTGDRRDFGHLYGHQPGGVKVIGLTGAIERILNQRERKGAAGTRVTPEEILQQIDADRR